MQTHQSPASAVTAPRFGTQRGGAAATEIDARSRLASDLRLFVLTYAGGFLFMTILLA